MLQPTLRGSHPRRLPVKAVPSRAAEHAEGAMPPDIQKSAGHPLAAGQIHCGIGPPVRVDTSCVATCSYMFIPVRPNPGWDHFQADDAGSIPLGRSVRRRSLLPFTV